MTEHEVKEISKCLLDHGNRKLMKEEKEAIKFAIDRASNMNELKEIAFSSIFIDANR